MSAIADNVKALRERIAAAAACAGRDPAGIRLVAVTKLVAAPLVAEALRCGITDAGENRVQEAAMKIPAVQSVLDFPVTWHMIGRLQSNKAAKAVELFSRIDSVHDAALARRLDRHAAERGKRPDILLEIRMSPEESKGGMGPGDLPRALEEIRSLEHLRVKGLMTMAPFTQDRQAVRAAFRGLRELFEAANARLPVADRMHTLSMGMSGDFEIAIEEGSTEIRVGQALFGVRRSV